jgi:polyribonucleotide nucleotidyltransferase
MSNIVTKTVELEDGRKIIVETGKLAKQANGSVVVKMGGTMILASVVSNQEANEGVDFMPLSVDYQERFAAAGKIPGGFLKREGKLSDYEVLISRLVDRALRPLFPDDYHAETQINLLLISADTSNPPDQLAAFAASTALAVSDIPFNGPVSEVRVIKVSDQLILNPSFEQMKNARLDIMVGATIDSITMVEGEMKEVSEDEMIEALQFAHEAIKKQCQLQKEMEAAVGKQEKRVYNHEVNDPELKERLFADLYNQVYELLKQPSDNKKLRKDRIKEIRDQWIEALPEDHEVNLDLVKRYYHDVEKKAARELVLSEKYRLDGRKTNEIRPIWCEIDYLPSAHGSAVFTRGETQSLTTVTLGTKMDEQMIDGAMLSGYNKFILHYNFPAFSTGEVRPNRGPGRREVGHGNLALRALRPVIPAEDENPYTIRIVSDILESNGSSSMATVCAGTLALMDSGIKIKKPVSGIAMGLISDPQTGRYAVLSDILGDEDHLGDMDFKVTGTEDGITACQMDIKVEGLSYETLKEALEQAKAGRLHILNEMKKVIAEPREEFKPHAPRFVRIVIEKELIGAVIGPGGKVVQEIQRETGATIVIEEIEKGGLVNIFATTKEALDKAFGKVRAIVAVPVIGEVYEGKVKSIMPFGAFVEFMPGKEGLLHISEIKWERLENMEGVLEVGEEIKVKLLEIDKKTGKFRLSRKVLLPRQNKPEDQGQKNLRV